jgi:hypothetical protein
VIFNRKALLMMAALTLFPVCASAGGQPSYEADLMEWLHVVQGDREPRLSDYLRFEGAGAEWELQLEQAECARRGWVPATGPDCIAYIRGRANDPSSATSLFFAHLRDLVPRDAMLGATKVRRLDPERPSPKLEMDLVETRIGTHAFEFVVPQNEVGQFGRLSINRIDGIGIDEWVSRWARAVEGGSKDNEGAHEAE